MSTLHHDPLGLPVHLADAASAEAVDDFVGGFIACEARVVNVLQAAEHDDSLYVQAAAAAVQMFAEAPGGPVAARPMLARGLRAAMGGQPVSARERGFALAVQAWVDDRVDEALRHLDDLLAEHPRDLAALKLAQYLAFNLGDSPAMLRLALRSLPAAADVPYVHGMAAFGWEQCHYLREAEAAARQALRQVDREPWAQHALAHVMLTEGRIAEGRAFMDEASAGWTGLNSFMETHNWWHLALFALEQGDTGAALGLYDRQVWGVCKPYSQDQVGAVSLLARLELSGLDVGDRWQDVADHLVTRTHDQVQPFLDLQYLYGLARAGRSEADVLMAQVERHAPQAPAASRQAWLHVAVPACRGLLAHARGDWTRAVEQLGVALPRLQEIGGSHAQRALFDEIHLDALMRDGRHVAAQQRLRPQALAVPQSQRLRRLLQRVDRVLGLPDGLIGDGADDGAPSVPAAVPTRS